MRGRIRVHEGRTGGVIVDVWHSLVTIFQHARDFVVFVGSWRRCGVGGLGRVLNGSMHLLLLGLRFPAQYCKSAIISSLHTLAIPILGGCGPVFYMICGPARIESRLYVFPAMAVRFHCVQKFLILDSISCINSSYF